MTEPLCLVIAIGSALDVARRRSFCRFGVPTGVSEAFGVHEINAQIFSHVQQVDISPATVPDASQFSLQVPLSPVDPTLLPQLGGRALLDQLGLVDADSLAAFVSAHPATVNQLLQHPPAAREVTGWWSGLPRSNRRRCSRRHRTLSATSAASRSTCATPPIASI